MIDKNMLLIGGAVLAAVVVLIALILLVVLVRRYLAFRRRMAEMTNMKKDLMAWQNLNGLVRGGNKGREAKAILSSKLGEVKDIFASGLRLIRNTAGPLAHRPWFVLVGEPKSGKTTLFARSGLEIRSGVSPDTMMESPLVTWLGPRAYTLDVAGRIFFDRWLKGSGAEWNMLVRSIRRKNRHFPANGIILTIPADALIGDDAALTREKASIIGSELQQLLKVTGMNLPCYVVITKLDMLIGFREYFFWLDGKDASAPFGWRNPAPGGSFDENVLTNWLDELDGRLRESLMARLLDPKVLRDPVSNRNRVDTAGASSLFPDSLKSLRANLSIYMSRLFGKEAWNAHDQLLLGGVFFTAAQDSGVTVSREFAQLCRKSVAEAPLVAEPKERPDGYFIGGLLNDIIFSCRLKASFTAGALFFRQLPGYFAALLIAALGVVWLFTAIFSRGVVKGNLDHLTDYYKSVAEHLRAEDYAASPLIARKDGKTVLLRDEALRSDPLNSRLTALSQFHMASTESVRAPFGYIASSLLWFSFNPDMAIDNRQAIANYVQNRMVYLPLFTALFEHFRADESPEFSQYKRTAMFDYYRYLLRSDSSQGDFINIQNVLLYLMPDLPPDLVNVLATYHPQARCIDMLPMADRFDNPQLAQEVAHQMGDRFNNAWRKLEIYPETLYPRTRSLIRSGDEMRQLVEDSAAIAKGIKAGETNVNDMIAKWQEELDRISVLRKQLDFDSEVLQSRREAKDVLVDALDTKLGVKFPGWIASDPLKDAVGDYRSLLEADAEEYSAIIAKMRKLLRSAAGKNYVKGLVDAAESMGIAVDASLTAESEELRGRMTRLMASRLLEPAPTGTDAEHPGLLVGMRNYSILGDLVEAARTVLLPEDPETLGDFFRTMKTLERQEELAEVKLQEAKGSWTNNQMIVGFAASVTELMRVRSHVARERLLTRYATLHPHDKSGVGEMIAALGNNEDIFGIPSSLAMEAFGGISIDSRYNAQAAALCFEVYAEMLALTGGKTPIEFPNRAIIERAMGEYVEDFVAYWASFGDNLQAPCGDWESFRKQCGEMKPYEVNTLLAIIYRKASAILSGIPKPCLKERQAKAVSDAIATIDARVQMLTPHFSDICIRQVTNWSLLSEDPTAGYRTLRACDAAHLVSDYFAVDAEGAKGNVPWWTSLFDNGLNLIKRDARKKGGAELSRSNAIFLRYPLCVDPVNKKPIEAEELDGIGKLLDVCGFAPSAVQTAEGAGAEKGAADKAKDDSANRIVAKVRAPYREDVAKTVSGVDYFDWGERMYAIVDTLRDRETETVWTLSVTPIERSRELNEAKFPDMPIANYRYRYGELFVGEEPRGARVALNSSTGVQVARGTIDDADITLRLDTYSDPNEESAVKLRFDGPWAILRLYLTPDSSFDEKSKSYDIPFVVRDRYNLTSILWLSLKINRVIPKPADWPSTTSWPDLPVRAQ